VGEGLGDGEPPGSTPLTEDDLEGLIPTFVAKRSDLNRVEQANIEMASAWLFRRRGTLDPGSLLTTAFANDLHRRMFGDVWRWAGARRLRETNIGVDPHEIPVAMIELFDDARSWNEHGTFPPPERAVRLHHRLVSIHPYRNGNGRHSRLMADAYLQSIEKARLSWGGRDLADDRGLRGEYLAALRQADGGNIEPLLVFASR